MKWFAIKGPDGEWDGCAALSKNGAWRGAFRCRVEFGYTMDMLVKNACNIDEMVDLAHERGYRCVEVQLVEPVEPGKGRVYEAMTDWIADLAMRDDGAVFWESTPDARTCPITYGDLRKLLRVAAEAEGITDNAAGDGWEGKAEK